MAADPAKAGTGRRQRAMTATLAALALFWVTGIAVGMKALYDHSGTPGAAAEAPASWPLSSGVALDTKRPTLVMLAHPRCPCTRASIAELAVLMTRARGQLSAHVVFAQPTGTDASFALGPLWERAREIPGAKVHVDPGGRLGARFGAKTSGQVVVYGTDGHLLFAGGITPARAHQGDNAGVDRVLAIARHGKAERSVSSVFGCGLFDEEEP